MDFNFEIPEIQKILSNNAQQEPLTAKERIDNMVLPQEQSQMPNSFQRQIEQAILEQKGTYANADNLAKMYNSNADDIRTNANNQANFLRDIANSAGLDMSGYGSGVTLEDATRNFASQRARDILGALNGQYSKSSDQYYTDTYYDLIREGHSARMAKKLAGIKAREYQANRVAYLDNTYNSYGRDGLITNSLGNQFLGSMAMEISFIQTIPPKIRVALTPQTKMLIANTK